MRSDVRPEAEVDRLVGHLLDREHAISEARDAGAIGVARGNEEIDDRAVAHQRELIAVRGQQRAELAHEGVVVAIDFVMLAGGVHCAIESRNAAGVKLARLPDSAHFIMFDTRERFAVELKAFLPRDRPGWQARMTEALRKAG